MAKSKVYMLLIDPIALDRQITLLIELIGSLIYSGKGQNSIDFYRGILETLEEIRCQYDDMHRTPSDDDTPSQ